MTPCWMTVDAVGTGAGRRDCSQQPNVTRLILGRSTEATSGPGAPEPVVVVETTVDDLDPQLWPGVLIAVRSAGACDCWTTATVGRHGRPGQVLTALCTEQLRPAVVDALFRQTITLGVRWATWQRSTLPRITVPVTIGPPGAERQISVKVAAGPGGERTITPEIADVEQVAQALGWPVRRVCDAARSAYQRSYSAGTLSEDLKPRQRLPDG